MQVTPTQVEGWQGAIERNPISFLCAILFLALVGVVLLWVRALLRVETIQKEHAREVDELRDAHATRVDGLRREELERAVRLEHLVQGVLKLVEMGGVEVRRGRRKKPTTNPGLPMEPDAPTLSGLPEEGSDE